MARYCVGASMEIDWGEEPQSRWDWCLVKRVFGYFRPYWRYGVGAIACLAVGAALGLVPAVVTKAVIDALAHPDRAFGRVLVLILLGVGASLVGGQVEQGSHLKSLERGGLYAELYERQFQAQEPASAQPVA